MTTARFQQWAAGDTRAGGPFQQSIPNSRPFTRRAPVRSCVSPATLISTKEPAMPRKKTAAAKKPARKGDGVAKRLTTKVPRIEPIPFSDYLSTGCTLLNLALTERPDGGIPIGAFFYIVGDSGSGKTWGAFDLLAEAAQNPRFGQHRFIFDNAENGALMDVAKFFGKSVAERLEPPMADKTGEAQYSGTVQEFYYNVERACRRGPCIYILDSMDALNDDAEDEHLELAIREYEGEKVKVPGTMGMNKAKTNSRNINRVCRRLRESGSILVVISQTRDMINSRIPGQKTRGGGKSLRFFAHLEIWTSGRGPLTKTYNGKEREIGATVRVDVRKNRVCGWEGSMDLPFYKGYGIDEPGSMVDYLVEEKHWAESDGKIDAPEFALKGLTREKLAQAIDTDDRIDKVREVVAQVWKSIKDGAAPNRRPRYS